MNKRNGKWMIRICKSGENIQKQKYWVPERTRKGAPPEPIKKRPLPDDTLQRPYQVIVAPKNGIRKVTVCHMTDLQAYLLDFVLDAFFSWQGKH